LLERVLDASPRDSDITFNLSVSFRYLRDFRRAEEYADLTISLAPDVVDGYVARVGSLINQGRLRDARVVLDELRVSSPLIETERIRLDIAERSFEAALARVHETPEAVYEQAFGPSAPGSRALDECSCYFFLGDRRGVQDSCGRARATLEEKISQFPNFPEYHYSLGLTCAFLGLKDEAVSEGERTVALEPVSVDAFDGPFWVERLAVIYSLVGEPEAAIEQIEYLLSIPSELTVGGLRVHPYWDPLRDRPRFQTLLEKYEVD